MRRNFGIRLIAAFGGLSLLSGCGGPAAEPHPATAQPGGLASRVLDLVDASRPTDPTPADAGTDARPGRSLRTHLLYPADAAGPLPLVVFSHGLGSRPEAYAELLSAWAEAGLVVAAPEFPLTAEGTAGVVDDVRNQPADVSFVISEVLARAERPGDPLNGRIDPRRVAVAGHSAGAVTTAGLLSRCCADPRIAAAIVLAGSPRGFGTDLAAADVPVLVVHGGADPVIAAAEGRAVYEAAPGPAAWLELPGATHSGPYDDDADPAFGAVRDTTTRFLRWALLDDAAALRDLRSAAPGLTADRLTPGG